MTKFKIKLLVFLLILLKYATAVSKHHYTNARKGRRLIRRVKSIHYKRYPRDLTANDYERQMKKCGFSNDTTSSYVHFDNYRRFGKFNIKYRIAQYTTDMSRCEQRKEIRKAFRAWEEVVNLKFEEATESTEDVDINILFVYGEHGDKQCNFNGVSLSLAHAFPNGDIHFDDSLLWSYGKGRAYTRTYAGNSNNASCVFPFLYKGIIRTSCIPVENIPHITWCATTNNFDYDRKFGLCESEHTTTFGGNSNGEPCYFPFVYKNKTYDNCIYKSETDRNMFCSTTHHYDLDRKWGYCPKRMNSTIEGNSNGGKCHFPFIYKNKIYTKCTTDGRSDGLLWCSTTSNYNNDGKHAFCDNGYSLFLVAVHEIGHVLGLKHTNNCLSIMHKKYGYVEKFALHEIDIKGARRFYGPQLFKLKPISVSNCTVKSNLKDTKQINEERNQLNSSNEKNSTKSKPFRIKASKKHDRLNSKHKKLKKYFSLQHLMEKKMFRKLVNNRKRICNLTSIDAAIQIQGNIRLAMECSNRP